MSYLVAHGAISLGYKSLTLPAMVVSGWGFAFFGDELATWLELPESNNPTVMALQNSFIQGLGWLALTVVTVLIAIQILNT
ncbi:MAG: hypothetical protein U5L74_12355 [Ideonella sp.]|nr:hypothetical protein [Ideonella sp.]